MLNDNLVRGCVPGPPRSKSLALHAVRSRSFNSDNGEDAEGTMTADATPPHALANQQGDPQEVPPPERKATDGSPATDSGTKEADGEKGGKAGGEEEREEEEEEEVDRLHVHLKNNMETIKAFCKEMVTQIPVPEQCFIEGNECVCVFTRVYVYTCACLRVCVCVCVYTHSVHTGE